jgi:hypothetical protein
MKKGLLYFILFFSVSHFTFSQDSIQLIPGYSIIKYLQRTASGPTIDNREVHIKLTYWKGRDPDSVRTNITPTFTIINYGSLITATNVSNPITINKNDIRAKHDTLTLTIHLSINAVVNLNMPEFFDIKLQGYPSSFAHRVTIQKDTMQYKTITVAPPAPIKKYADTSDCITYLNGVNFDFDKKTNANYVGIFNVFCPELKSWPNESKKTRYGWGFNVGLMKINYAKAGDSINNTSYFSENALMNPLDSVKNGKKYLRQYNKLDGVTKNTTFSVFGQPMTGIFLEDKFKLLIHGHFEFLVSKWTTTSTIANLQQDTAVFNGTEDKPSTINRFAKSTSDPLITSSTITYLSMYTGWGLTCVISPWRGSTVFVQYSSGKVVDFGQPKPSNQPTPDDAGKNKQYGFFLTRASIKQRLTTKVDIILGTEIRGLFSLQNGYSNGPVYSCYAGILIQADALMDLFK